MTWSFRPGAVALSVVLAVIAASPFASPPPPELGHYFFEIALSSDVDGNAQIYCDLGHGFNESDSSRQPLRAKRPPAICRFDLPTGTCRLLRFDPIDRAGTVTLADAKIVDREGRIIRRFDSLQFQPAHQIASLTPKEGSLEIRTAPGADDPYLALSIDRPIDLPSSLGWWHRIKAALPAFAIVFLAAFAVAGMPLPFRKIASWRPSERPRLIAAAAIALVLFKLWLVSAQTISAIGGSIVDDESFLTLASSLLSGQWLGPYNQFTLMKGPMYPLFIAGVFLLGIPLFVAQHLLYAAACGLVSRALKPLVASNHLRFGLFAALLFNPITYDGIVGTRVQRQDILPALVLMIVAGFLAIYARRAEPIRRLWPWAVLTGVALPAFWLAREEGVWLLPCAGLLWAAAAVAIWREHAPDRRARLALLVLPGLLWAAGVATVAGINWHYYGVFTTCEFKQADFKAAFGALLRVTPERQLPYIPITREVRERLYAVSPAFAELRPYFEGPSGEGWAEIGNWVSHLPATEREIPVGWTMWALRDAVVTRGHGHTGAEAMAYYAQLAREVNDACDRGLIKAGARRTGFLSPFRREQLIPVLDASQRALTLVFSFDRLTAMPMASVGPPDRLAFFADLTRGRLCPAADGPRIPPKQRWLDRVRLTILGCIGRAYPLIGPWAGGAAVFALLAAGALALIRRRLPYLLVVSAGMLGSITAMAMIIALIDVTSYPAVDVGYLTGTYGLWLLFLFTSWLALAEILQDRPRPPLD